MWDWADPNKNGLNASIAHTRDALDPAKNGVTAAFNKVGNEFTNPNSDLAHFGQAVGHEFTDDTSLMRSKILPGVLGAMSAIPIVGEAAMAANAGLGAANAIQHTVETGDPSALVGVAAGMIPGPEGTAIRTGLKVGKALGGGAVAAHTPRARQERVLAAHARSVANQGGKRPVARG